ncbi:MAG: carboxymuconolactone decarboxylase family protein [Methanobacteriaceae archaeon]|nr:carboxymuconolactone decarboxylase family protein [Methanobacteriaceae archaeon]
MKNEEFYSNGMNYIKKDYPELYKEIVSLNDTVYNGKILNYRTQKLIAIALVSAQNNDIAIKKQIKSGIEEFNMTRDEIMDVLKIVLLISGKPAFTKATSILYSILSE